MTFSKFAGMALCVAALFNPYSVFAQWVPGAGTLSTSTDLVGIGTNTPVSLLHVKGNSAAVRIETDNSLPAVSQYSDIIFTDPAVAGTQRNWVIRSIGPNHPTNPNSLEFWSPENSTSNAFFVGDNLKFGIGTTKPLSPFHVIGNSGAVRIETDGSVEATAQYSDIIFVDPAVPNTQRNWIIRSIGPNHPTFSNTLEFWSPENDNGKVYIPGSGTKMGIGTYDMPGDYSLYVLNGILTEKVKVALPGSAQWADYVFDEGYELRPLSEVEAYIQTEGHLPGVPSAEEVADQGIDVATMDAKLLEKIEELTLYVIELKKQNDQLQQAMQELNK